MSLRDILRTESPEVAREQLSTISVEEIEHELTEIEPTRRAVLFRLLSRSVALEVFEAMDAPVQAELIDALRDETVIGLIEELDPDDRVQLLDEMPAKLASRLMSGLSPQEREATATLLGYPPDSAGRNMSPEYVSLRADMQAQEALEKIRHFGERAETIYALPVIDQSRILVGITGLRKLVLAPATTLIEQFMNSDVISAKATDDQEDAARKMRERGLLAMPVVDSEERLVGIITFDDAMRVLEEEESEDIARSGASQPLKRPYLSIGTLGLARLRVTWLLFLGLAATMSVSVLQQFQDTLQDVVALAFFMPLVAGLGGNAGSQSAITVIRALALGDVSVRDWLRIVTREARVGLMLGCILATISLLPISTLFYPGLAFAVAFTLVCVCLTGSIVGGSLPLILEKLGVDPAIAGAPLLTTLIDAGGLLIYLSIAKATL